MEEMEKKKNEEGALTGRDVGSLNVSVGTALMVRLNILTLRSDMHPSVTQIFPRFFRGRGTRPGRQNDPQSLATFRRNVGRYDHAWSRG